MLGMLAPSCVAHLAPGSVFLVGLAFPVFFLPSMRFHQFFLILLCHCGLQAGTRHYGRDLP